MDDQWIIGELRDIIVNDSGSIRPGRADLERRFRRVSRDARTRSLDFIELSIALEERSAS